MNKWIETEIGKIGNVISGGTPSTAIPAYWDGEILFVTPYDLSKITSAYIEHTARKISEAGLANSSATILPAGSIAISSRAPIGYVAIGKKSFTTNQGCKSIALNEAFDAEYIYYSLLQNVDKLKRLGAGTTFAEISKADLEKVTLLHPISKKRQQRIGAILSTCDTVIEKTQVAIAKYKAIKQGMLQDLFTRGIDVKTGKLRPRFEDAPHLYKGSPLGLIPLEWEVKDFGKEVDLVHGHQFRNYDFTEYGIPVIKIGQVKPEGIDLSNCSYVSNHRVDEFQNEIIRNGDVLMALTGATLGKACLVRSLNGIVLQNYRVGRFEPLKKENDIDKKWLYYLMIAGELLTQIFNKVNTGAQGNIGKADFEKATFKKTPYIEQVKIAERLSVLDDKLMEEQKYFEKMLQLKRGLMEDLLTGKKQVKVTDEKILMNE